MWKDVVHLVRIAPVKIRCEKPQLMSRRPLSRRLSAGEGTGPITLLRDIDQPFIFEIKLGQNPYRLEFYDTNSPENWKLLDPDIVILCYDISQRLSLINMRRHVRSSPYNPPHPRA